MPLEPLSAGRESQSRAPEPGQRAGGASGPSRDPPSPMARVKLYILYDKVFGFQTWEVLGQAAACTGEADLWEGQGGAF